MALPVVSLLVTSIAALLQLFLTFQVIKRRRAEQASIDKSPSVDLQRAIRAHGNFTEVTPIFLILIILLELVDSFLWWVGGLGILFLVGRVLHARSILVDEVAAEPRFQNRVRGMVMTITSIGLAAVSGPVFIAWFILGGQG